MSKFKTILGADFYSHLISSPRMYKDIVLNEAYNNTEAKILTSKQDDFVGIVLSGRTISNDAGSPASGPANIPQRVLFADEIPRLGFRVRLVDDSLYGLTSYLPTDVIPNPFQEGLSDAEAEWRISQHPMAFTLFPTFEQSPFPFGTMVAIRKEKEMYFITKNLTTPFGGGTAGGGGGGGGTFDYSGLSWGLDKVQSKMCPEGDILADIKLLAGKLNIPVAFLMAIRAKESKNAAGVRLELNKFYGAKPSGGKKVRFTVKKSPGGGPTAWNYGGSGRGSSKKVTKNSDGVPAGTACKDYGLAKLPYTPYCSRKPKSSVDYSNFAGKSTFKKAYSLDGGKYRVCAIDSTSWGYGQVMGYQMKKANHPALKNYRTDPDKAVTYFFANPVKAGTDLMYAWFGGEAGKNGEAAKLARAAAATQDELAWRTFAKKYNGSFKKGGYGFKLRGWYNKILKECPGAK